MDIIKGLFSKLWEEFGWLLGGLAVIGIIWFWNGGADRQSAHEGAYIKPLAPVDTGEVYGRYYAGAPSAAKATLNLPDAPAEVIRHAETAIENFFAKSKEAERIHATSVLTHSLSFDGVAGARAKDPNAEYLRLVASGLASTPIKISGLTLEGGYFDGTIPLPQSAAKQDIWLAPGDRVVVSTGVSPVGGNFRVDACSSYLSGASRLVPALRKSAYSGTMTYKECAARHGEESGFYTNEWRIFLGQTVELWGDSSDIIKLVDAKGKVVDALTY